MEELAQGSVKAIMAGKVRGDINTTFSDVLSVEEPLEIRIAYGSKATRIQKNISVTMRTPGNDIELALGFLFTEGIFCTYEQIQNVVQSDMVCTSQKGNIVVVEFSEGFVPFLQQSERNFYTTSSCGVCGKSSIQSIKTVSPFYNQKKEQLVVSKNIFCELKGKLRTAQSGFAATGGSHASGLFSINGKLICLREDVGRHNALDKLIGSSLIARALPLDQHILMLSGRVSFELMQKAAMAGISIIAAIGAPSSLAVELARELDLTLIGFLKEDSFNIYNLSDNVSL